MVFNLFFGNTLIDNKTEQKLLILNINIEKHYRRAT